jgi:hypothetical protein
MDSMPAWDGAGANGPTVLCPVDVPAAQLCIRLGSLSMVLTFLQEHQYRLTEIFASHCLQFFLL